jgi:xylulokinase
MRHKTRDALMGIDVGTSGCKVALFDLRGSLQAEAYRSYPLVHPKPGWVEEEPLQGWWKAASEGIREVLTLSRIPAESIGGISISCTNALVCVDRNGAPLRNAIMQIDRRSIPQTESLQRLVGEKRIFQAAGNRIAPGTFSAPLILWIKENEPEIFDRTFKFLVPTGFLVHQLTGEYVMDWSRGATTLLFETGGSRSWSAELCEMTGIPEEKLPRSCPSWEVVGEVSRLASEETGLAPGTPVVAGAMDTVAAALGSGVVSSGESFYVLGSVGRICLCLDQPAFDARFINTCHCVPDYWISIACTNGAGLSLRWFKEQLGEWETAKARETGESPFRLLDSQALRSLPGANRLLYLPYLAGERSPIWDPYARGVLFGLDAAHQKGDLVRAFMEGAAFAARDNFESFETGLKRRIEGVRMSGGGSRSILWQEITADILGKELAILELPDTETFGNALLAGLGTGIYPDIRKTATEMAKIAKWVKPRRRNTELYARLYRLYKQVYAHLKGDFRELGALALGDDEEESHRRRST